MKISVGSFLEKKYYEKIKSTIEKNKEYIKKDFKDSNRIEKIELKNIKIKNTYNKKEKNATYLINTIVEAKYSVSSNDVKRVYEKLHNVQIRASIEDLKNNKIEILKVINYNSKMFNHGHLNDSLLPPLDWRDYDSVATEILEVIYPEILDGSAKTGIDVYKFANRLGLKIIEPIIYNDPNFIGRIYFEKDCLEIPVGKDKNDYYTMDVEPGTIIVNPLICLGRKNNTILHECVHWIIHKDYFQLKKIITESESLYDEIYEKDSKENRESSLEIAECQANRIAPRILMPKDIFVKELKKQKEMLGDYYEKEPKAIEELIDSLANYFKASKASVKVRMQEVGYQEAIGAYNYVDEHYVMPHRFKENYISFRETFTIPLDDAIILDRLNEELKDTLANEEYVFVDNHYVINSPKYVKRNEKDELILTKYALNNMHECCLKFTMNFDEKYQIPEDMAIELFLNREKSPFEINITYKDGKNTPSKSDVYQTLKRIEKIDSYLRKMPEDDPPQCFKLALEWADMKQTTLSDLTDISESTITRYLNNSVESIKYKTMVTICLAMELPAKICERLLSAYNCRKLMDNDEHKILSWYIQYRSENNFFANVKELKNYYGIEIVKEKEK